MALCASVSTNDAEMCQSVIPTALIFCSAQWAYMEKEGSQSVNLSGNHIKMVIMPQPHTHIVIVTYGK